LRLFQNRLPSRILGPKTEVRKTCCMHVKHEERVWNFVFSIRESFVTTSRRCKIIVIRTGSGIRQNQVHRLDVVKAVMKVRVVQKVRNLLAG
jgi:hypothetical protein